MELGNISPESLVALAPPSPDDRRAAIAYHIEALEELADPPARGEGWTAFSRKLFLIVLAETGRVTTACDYCCLSKQSAYALRARDAVFAAGWDAACELARTPLADALYEQAVDGLTETVTRDDGHTITRHRFDSRLSIAVLHRLDRRCERAADRGSPHLGAVRQWGDFIGAIGSDDHARAQAILAPAETAQLSQPSQPGAASTPAIDHVWWDENEEEWRTDFLAPPGFDGYEAEDQLPYERSLTDEERELVERNCAANNLADRGEEEAKRDAFFAALRAADAGEAPAPHDSGLELGAVFVAAADEQADEPEEEPEKGDSGVEPPGPGPAPPRRSGKRGKRAGKKPAPRRRRRDPGPECPGNADDERGQAEQTGVGSGPG